jgi:transglutaminase-like putative cysteine protease
MNMLHAPRLSQVSRDGRDTLWLLLALSLCILPHVGRLPLWCTVGTACAIAWRARLAWLDAPLPPRWVLMVALALSIGLTLMTHQSLLGRQAGVTLVTLLAALKTLELRARRDAFVITSLGFFLILTQFLHSQSIGIAALMLLATLGLMSSLVLAQRPTGRPRVLLAVGAAARSMVMGVPVMLALYLLFPRFGPLWSIPSDGGPRTGLSDNIQLGRMAELAQDDSVALRVRFEGRAPPPHEMYFRGPVLDDFDGRNWRARPALQSRAIADEAMLRGTAISGYQITIEPTRLRNVPLLEGTLVAAASPPMTQPVLHRHGLSWMSPLPLTDRAQVTAQAWLGTQEGPASQTPESLREWTQLPAGFNPRTLAWAMALRSQPGLRQASARELSQVVLRHIRDGDFRYTLSPEADGLGADGRPEIHLVDQFWLDRRTGFCEHFATAYVVVMRAMDVPARVVTGFQGAELNPVDGLHVVRNSDAHAWAEHWQDGEGWVRVDPTAAVAPNRIDRLRPPIRNPDNLPAALARIDPQVWSGLRAYMDAANHRWNTWVLQYSRNKQVSLLKDWGFDSPDWTTLLRLCAALLAGLSLAGLAWLWWRRPRTKHTPWSRAMMRLHRGLVAAGLPAPAGCPAPAPALAWWQVVKRHEGRPETREPLLQALQALDALRYAPVVGPAPEQRARLRRLLKEALERAKQLQSERSRARG